MWQKLKSVLLDDQVFYSFLVILVGGVSFLLGRFSVLETYSTTLQSAVRFSINTELQEKLALPLTVEIVGGQVVASKTGTKYHRPDCPGAKQIKVENQISFPSAEAAQAAGYTPASNCPGLK